MTATETFNKLSRVQKDIADIYFALKDRRDLQYKMGPSTTYNKLKEISEFVTLALTEIDTDAVTGWMNQLANECNDDLDVGADEGAVDAGVLKHLDAWLAKRFWFDTSRQDQARIEIRRFLELLPADEVRDWFDKGWTEILEAAELAH